MILDLGGSHLNIEEQRRLLKMWVEFLGDRLPSNSLMRQFYFEEILDSNFYRYGMAAEFFDILVNGVFDADEGIAPVRAPEKNTRGGGDGEAPTRAA